MFSVIIPNYNCEELIKRAVESCLSDSNIKEIIIIDDGSTDNSIKVIESINDSRIILIKNETNMGIGYSRNKGLETASSEFILFLDSDDYFVNINKVTDWIEEHSDLDMIIYDFKDNIRGFRENKFKENQNVRELLNTNYKYAIRTKIAKECKFNEDRKSAVPEMMFIESILEKVESISYINSRAMDSYYYYEIREGSFSDIGFNRRHLRRNRI